MQAIHFDTLEVATKFKQVGFTEAQAEILVQIHRQAIDSALEQAQHDFHLDEISTKRDLKELETSLKHDIELLRAESKRDIAETKADLTRWIIGAGFLQTTLIIGALMKVAHLI